MKTITAVILTWNSEKYIINCLDSLYNSTGLDLICYVIDNGSTDGTIDLIQNQHYSNLELIKLDKNYGTTVPRNKAIAKSHSDYLLILDSDTIIQPGAIQGLLNVAESDSSIGIVAPRLLYPDGTVQPSFKKIPTITIKLYKGVPIKRLNKIGTNLELYDSQYYTTEFNGTIPVDYCISACWLVCRDAITKVGLLDEHIFYAPEDLDYCLRMWLNNYKVVYTTQAEVVHYTQRISHKNPKMFIAHAKGLLYYFWKYKYFFDRNRIYRKIDRTYPYAIIR